MNKKINTRDPEYKDFLDQQVGQENLDFGMIVFLLKNKSIENKGKN